MRIVRHPDVLEELINLAYHIALDDFDAANGFLDACEEAFSQLAKMPQLGAQRTFNHPDLREVRMWPTKGFEKYLVFYRPREDAIEILSRSTLRQRLRGSFRRGIGPSMLTLV
jgi:toxin ParE1/3/4